MVDIAHACTHTVHVCNLFIGFWTRSSLAYSESKGQLPPLPQCQVRPCIPCSTSGSRNSIKTLSLLCSPAVATTVMV